MAPPGLKGLGVRVSGLGFRGLGFGGLGVLGYWVLGLERRVWGLGFRGLGFATISGTSMQRSDKVAARSLYSEPYGTLASTITYTVLGLLIIVVVDETIY